MQILIVEDEAISRKTLTMYVRSMGYDTLAAADGHEAMTLWRQHRPQIVLTDWNMPEMDGIELCIRIRSAETDGYTYIIMITSRKNTADLIQGFESGADDYLTKPVNKAELVVRLKAIVRIFRLKQVEALAQEVFQRKRAEKALQQLNLELEARVRQRTRELEEANQQLEAFSYSVSHDLRAPLRTMTGFSRILMEKHADGLSADGLKMCVMIHDSATVMGRLIDDLLAFSRAGRRALHTTRVDMMALVQSVIEELRKTEEVNWVDFRIGDLPAAMADPNLMRQVWINLLSNAVKFSSGKARPVVAVDAKPEGGEVVYRVQDNGAGFDMQHAHKLFGVFQRLHQANDFEGTGVGLAIVQQIVTRHGGRVWAHGEPERGATFYFSLAV